MKTASTPYLMTCMSLVVMLLFSAPIKSENNYGPSELSEFTNDCCEKRGGTIDKPSKLVFTYTGGGCSFNSTNSPEGKHECVNGSVVNESQNISVLDDGQLIGGSRTISEGEVVEIYVKKGGGNDFGNELQVRIGNQIVEIHTSCSDGLVTGQNYGALRLDLVNGANGSECGIPVPPCELEPGSIEEDQSLCSATGFDPEIITSVEDASFTGSCIPAIPPGINDCCDKGGGIIDKLSKLTFVYIGGGCSFNSISSPKGKHECINSSSVNGSQSISVIDEGQLIGGSRTINEGDIIEIFVKEGGGNNFGNELQVKIGSQIVEIHTSCSDGLVPG